MNNKLVGYIKNQRDKGFSYDVIKNALLKAGYDVKTVNEYVDYAFKKKIIKNKALICLLVILFFSVGFYVYYQNIVPENRFKRYNNSGFDFYGKDSFEEALGQFNEAVKIKPNDDNIHSRLGWTYYELGNYEQAIIEFKKSIELNSGNHMAHSGLGQAYLTMKEYDSAFYHLNEAVLLNDQSPWHFFRLASYFYEIGDYSSAKENIDKCFNFKFKDEKNKAVGLRAEIYEKS